MKTHNGVEVVSDYRSDTMWIFRLQIQQKEFHVVFLAKDDCTVEITFSVLKNKDASYSMLMSLFRFCYETIIESMQTLKLFKNKQSSDYKLLIVDTHMRRIKLYSRLFKRYQAKGQAAVDNKFKLSNVNITNNVLEIFIQRT